MGSFGSRVALVMALLALLVAVLLGAVLIQASVFMLRGQAIASGIANARMLAEASVQKEEILQRTRPNRRPLADRTPMVPAPGQFLPPAPAPAERAGLSRPPRGGAPAEMLLHLKRFARILEAMQVALIVDHERIFAESSPLADDSLLSTAQIAALWLRLEAMHDQDTLVEVQPTSIATLVKLPSTEDQDLRAVLVQIPTTTVNDITTAHARSLWLSAAVIAVLAALLSFWLSRSITRPLSRLARAAQRFGAGDLGAHAAIQGPRETRVLADVLNHMAGSLQRQMAELESETARRTQLETELEIAAHLQSSLLPPPGVHCHGPLRVAGWNRQAREVGGDFYDLWELEDGRLAVVIGDASGKGMTAALLAATCLSAIRAASEVERAAGDVLRRANASMFHHFRQEFYFVTVALALFDPRNRSLEVSLAGHPPVLLITPDDGVATLSSRQGYPLGIFPDTAFETLQKTIQTDCSVLLCTDGITETFNEAQELYGMQHLRCTLESGCALSVDALLLAQVEDLERFRGKATIADDATLVALRFERG